MDVEGCYSLRSPEPPAPPRSPLGEDLDHPSTLGRQFGFQFVDSLIGDRELLAQRRDRGFECPDSLITVIRGGCTSNFADDLLDDPSDVWGGCPRVVRGGLSIGRSGGQRIGCAAVRACLGGRSGGGTTLVPSPAFPAACGPRLGGQAPGQRRHCPSAAANVGGGQDAARTLAMSPGQRRARYRSCGGRRRRPPA